VHPIATGLELQWHTSWTGHAYITTAYGMFRNQNTYEVGKCLFLYMGEHIPLSSSMPLQMAFQVLNVPLKFIVFVAVTSFYKLLITYYINMFVKVTEV
jgi:hypothetical protein